MVRKLAKQHARVAHIHKDATHKVTSYLGKNHARIAIEDWHVSGMLNNHKLAQAISDSNFAEIRRQLTYKAERSGSRLVVLDRFYPSRKTCSACGYVKPALGLHERMFVCAAWCLTVTTMPLSSWCRKHYELPGVRREVTPVDRAALAVSLAAVKLLWMKQEPTII